MWITSTSWVLKGSGPQRDPNSAKQTAEDLSCQVYFGSPFSQGHANLLWLCRWRRTRCSKLTHALVTGGCWFKIKILEWTKDIKIVQSMVCAMGSIKSKAKMKRFIQTCSSSQHYCSEHFFVQQSLHPRFALVEFVAGNVFNAQPVKSFKLEKLVPSALWWISP